MSKGALCYIIAPHLRQLAVIPTVVERQLNTEDNLLDIGVNWKRFAIVLTFFYQRLL